jgi:hypothetical protein
MAWRSGLDLADTAEIAEVGIVGYVATAVAAVHGTSTYGLSILYENDVRKVSFLLRESVVRR